MSFECVTMLSGAAILLFLIYSDKDMTMVENFKQLNTMSERKNGRKVSCPRSPEYKQAPMIHFDKCQTSCKKNVVNVCEDPLSLDGPLKYDDKTVNKAYMQFLTSENKALDQIGLLLQAPNNKQVTGGSQPTGVNDSEWKFPSQRLVGPANPKTLIAPVVPARALDNEYWRTNNLGIRSGINAMTPFDAENSGYKIQPCPKPPLPLPTARCYQLDNTMPRNPPCGRQPIQPDIIEGFDHPGSKGGKEPTASRLKIPYLKGVRRLDDVGVDMAAGYNQEQLLTGLPTNLPTSRCERMPEFTLHNDKVFTETVQPGVYQNSQIIEPINAMIGISMTTPIPPTTTNRTASDGLLYQQHDPNLYEEPPPECVPKTANTYNTTDPRFTGYGTSYREYLEPMTGQSRFFYKDVDAIKMPNYVCRSKIDCNPWADKYGPVPEGDARGNKYTQDIRTLANNAFLDATIEQRTGLMQSCMRKRNAEMWQQKMYPISRAGMQKAAFGKA